MLLDYLLPEGLLKMQLPILYITSFFSFLFLPVIWFLMFSLYSNVHKSFCDHLFYMLWSEYNIISLILLFWSFYVPFWHLLWSVSPFSYWLLLHIVFHILILWIVFLLNCVLGMIYIFDGIDWSTAVVFLFLYSIAFFEGVSFPQFKAFREPIRALSLLWLYISTISISIFMFTENSYWLVFFLLLSLAFNVYVHARFENYPSLVFSTIIPVPLYFFFFGFSENFWSFLISSFLLTLGLTFFGRIVRTSYRGDEYVFQTVAMIVLLGSTISFGWRVGIVGIFEYSVLLLLFSGMIFVSYLQIRK